MSPEHHHPVPSDDEPLDQVEYANKRLADELSTARLEMRELSEESLRALAAHLISPVTRDTTAINRLAVGEPVTLAELTPEGLAIASDPRTPPTARNALDWIATSLLLREHPDVVLETMPISFAQTGHVLVSDQLQVEDQEPVIFRRRAGLPSFYLDLLGARLRDHLTRRSDILRAYLTLSDVDADDLHLLDHLERSFLGDYDDIVDAVTTITPYFQWRSELAEWAHERGLEDLVDIDHDGLTERAYEWWRIAEMKGRTYVFARS